MCGGSKDNGEKLNLRISVQNQNGFVCNYLMNVSATKNEEMVTCRKSVRRFKIGIFRK